MNGYEEYVDGEVSDLADAVEAVWMRSRELPDDLFELRCVLFMQQRRYRFWGWDPKGVDAKFIRALVAAIGVAGDGWVPGPHYLELREEEIQEELDRGERIPAREM